MQTEKHTNTHIYSHRVMMRHVNGTMFGLIFVIWPVRLLGRVMVVARLRRMLMSNCARKTRGGRVLNGRAGECSTSWVVSYAAVVVVVVVDGPPDVASGGSRVSR